MRPRDCAHRARHVLVGTPQAVFGTGGFHMLSRAKKRTLASLPTRQLAWNTVASRGALSKSPALVLSATRTPGGNLWTGSSVTTGALPASMASCSTRLKSGWLAVPVTEAAQACSRLLAEPEGWKYMKHVQRFLGFRPGASLVMYRSAAPAAWMSWKGS